MILKIEVTNLLKRYGYKALYDTYYMYQEEIRKDSNGAFRKDCTERFTIYTPDGHIVGRLYDVLEYTTHITEQQLEQVIVFFQEYKIPHHKSIQYHLIELLNESC